MFFQMNFQTAQSLKYSFNGTVVTSGPITNASSTDITNSAGKMRSARARTKALKLSRRSRLAVTRNPLVMKNTSTATPPGV